MLLSLLLALLAAVNFGRSTPFINISSSSNEAGMEVEVDAAPRNDDVVPGDQDGVLGDQDDAFGDQDDAFGNQDNAFGNQALHHLSPDVLVGQLIDQQCDSELLQSILNLALARNHHSLFSSACVACLSQYDADEDGFVEILDTVVAVADPIFFESLLENQCKGVFATKVLSQIHFLGEDMLKVAIKECNDLLPKDALNLWRSDMDAAGMDGVQLDGGVTFDAHASVAWPYTSQAGPKAPRRLEGVVVEYAETGEGRMERLGDMAAAIPGITTAADDTGVTRILAWNMAPTDPRRILGATSTARLSSAVSAELFKNSNRFRASIAAVTRNDEDGLTIAVGSLNDGGPQILVVRDGDLVYPQGMATYSPDALFKEGDFAIWAQPSPRYCFPLFSCTKVALRPGDIILSIPIKVQLLANEIDIRGLMYGTEAESLPETIGNLAKNIYLKHKTAVTIAAAVVV